MARTDITGPSSELLSPLVCGPPQRPQGLPTAPRSCPGHDSSTNSTSTAQGSRTLQRSPHRHRLSPSGSLRMPWTKTSSDQSRMANSVLRPSACCSRSASRRRLRGMKHSRSSKIPARTCVGPCSSLHTHSAFSPQSLLLALAYYAYALGEPFECLDYLAKVPTVADAQSHIPFSSTVGSDGSTLQPSGSRPDTSTSWTGSFLSAESPPPITNIIDGRAWAMAESIRSICLQG